MLTYHQVQGYLQKSVALSKELRKLREMMTPVLQIFESIDQRDEELTVHRDVLYGEISSVELLGEVVRQQVYNQFGECSPEESVVTAPGEAGTVFSEIKPKTGNWTNSSGDYVI